VTYAIARVEYGDPLLPAEAEWLRSYSPVHTVPESADFPPTLFIAGENDPRCPPWHARKLLSLMAAVDPDAELLLRVHKDQGHGASSRALTVERRAEWLAFVAHHTGLQV
jgi:prolyl oligopeptidase